MVEPLLEMWEDQGGAGFGGQLGVAQESGRCQLDASGDASGVHDYGFRFGCHQLVDNV